MLEFAVLILVKSVLFFCFVSGCVLILSGLFLFFRMLFLSIKTHFKPELVQKDGKYAVRKFQWLTGYVYLCKMRAGYEIGEWVYSEDLFECWFASEKEAEDNYKKVKDLEKASKNRIKKVKNIGR